MLTVTAQEHLSRPTAKVQNDDGALDRFLKSMNLKCTGLTVGNPREVPSSAAAKE